jgi:sortase A
MPPSHFVVAPNAKSGNERTGPPGQVFFRVLPGLLTLAGLLLIFYVASQYAWMYIEQQRFSHELQEQAPVSQANTSPAPRSSGAALARLLIPKIHLDVALVEGTTRKALLVGPGHLVNTAMPGDRGNVVLAGHRDTFFRHLGDLSRGDPITIVSGGKQYVYRVTGTEIVEPSDTQVLNSSSAYRLTLITCYPFHYLGPAPKRFIVFAQLAGNQTESSLPALAPQPSRP